MARGKQMQKAGECLTMVADDAFAFGVVHLVV